MMFSDHLRMARWTSDDSLHFLTLHLGVSANAKPSYDVKASYPNPQLSMIQLVEGGTNDGLAFLKTLHYILIILIFSNLTPLEASTSPTVPTVMHTIPTNVKSTSNET